MVNGMDTASTFCNPLLDLVLGRDVRYIQPSAMGMNLGRWHGCDHEWNEWNGRERASLNWLYGFLILYIDGRLRLVHIDSSLKTYNTTAGVCHLRRQFERPPDCERAFYMLVLLKLF